MSCCSKRFTRKQETKHMSIPFRNFLSLPSSYFPQLCHKCKWHSVAVAANLLVAVSLRILCLSSGWLTLKEANVTVKKSGCSKQRGQYVIMYTERYLKYTLEHNTFEHQLIHGILPSSLLNESSLVEIAL